MYFSFFFVNLSILKRDELRVILTNFTIVYAPRKKKKTSRSGYYSFPSIPSHPLSSKASDISPSITTSIIILLLKSYNLTSKNCIQLHCVVDEKERGV